jgi:hypothetical protein
VVDAVTNFEIKPGEEFASIVFSAMEVALGSELIPGPVPLGDGFWVSGSLPMKLDDWWRQQLGVIVSDRIERFVSFVITAKGATTADRLRDRAQLLFWGICVVAGIAQFETAYPVWGNLEEAKVYQLGSRVAMGLSKVYRGFGIPKPNLGIAELKQAVKFAERIEQIIEVRDQDVTRNNNPFTPLYLRPMSGFAAFQSGAEQAEPAYRLHQFVRTVEAFMPASVRGANDFAERATLFLKPDPRNKDVLKELYDLRSATEHHRPFDQPALPGVGNPNDIAMQRTRQAETLAREALRRLLSGSQDHRPHLKDESSLENFWANSQQVSQAWGTPIDINAVP